MDFVAATANLRAYAFGIPMKSLFDIKCTFKAIAAVVMVLIG